MGRRIPHPALVNPHLPGVLGRGAAIHSQARRLPLPGVREGRTARSQARWRLVGRIGPASALQELSRVLLAAVALFGNRHFSKSRRERATPDPEREAWMAYLNETHGRLV